MFVSNGSRNMISACDTDAIHRGRCFDGSSLGTKVRALRLGILGRGRTTDSNAGVRLSTFRVLSSALMTPANIAMDSGSKVAAMSGTGDALRLGTAMRPRGTASGAIA